MKSYLSVILSFFTFTITGCVTTPNIVNVETVSTTQPIFQPIKAEASLKRKVAIARFTNEAQYSKSSLFGVTGNYSAEKQATDILSAKLAQSGKFILLERSDIHLLEAEANKYNLSAQKIGADYLIVGSITEFGRHNMSDTGVFSRTKTQTAYAKVSIRLINVATGEIIFAQEGSGESSSEAGTAFGVGKHVGYDSTLNDKAISTAISSVVDGVMQNLLNNPWRSYVLSCDANSVIIAGGQKQGVKIGDTFSIFSKGQKVKNPQTGMLIELPGNKIAEIKIASQFGSSYTDEGSIGIITSGMLNKQNIGDLYVEEK